jgi:hypothetical protein
VRNGKREGGKEECKEGKVGRRQGVGTVLMRMTEAASSMFATSNVDKWASFARE